ncbi:SDR family oxidoreductase [Verrucomicrobiaceae bacterium N1E253]|uniref:SDR family oxidoreductase n=1 Tax=Oceaniferula marina TaxID=2748318 RepID=A0A851GK17_9BACT|nr:SDR family NAD(P)-dependent oxidoreductase [Oceaniferula marina]NWK55437.1 SDR family oxidoreductase [Oceaniferula marina]
MNRQSAWVSGGKNGLGKAIAAALRSAGMEVASPGSSDLDVRDADAVQTYAEGMNDLDLLVCNAGVTADKPLARMTEADWEQVMDVNLNGAFRCARAAARSMMKRRGGHIILISSYSAVHPPAGQANYAASKAALIGMMRSMAKELGPRNVRVNVVLPGFLETRMTEGLADSVKESSRSRHVLGRYNTVEAVGDFICFLHRSMPHTSGQVFNLDSRV